MVLALQALLNLQASSFFYQPLILAGMPQQLNGMCIVISITYVHGILWRSCTVQLMQVITSNKLVGEWNKLFTKMHTRPIIEENIHEHQLFSFSRLWLVSRQRKRGKGHREGTSLQWHRLKAKLASSQEVYENCKMETLSKHNDELTNKLDAISSTSKAPKF
jgi:hypothetical protein